MRAKQVCGLISKSIGRDGFENALIASLAVSLRGWSRPLGQSSSILHSARLISPSFACQPVYVCESDCCLPGCGWDYSNSVKGPFSARRVWKILPLSLFWGHRDEAAAGCVTAPGRWVNQENRLSPKMPSRRHTTHCEWISRLTDGLESNRIEFLNRITAQRCRPIGFLLSAPRVWNWKCISCVSLCVQSREDASRRDGTVSGTWCGVSLFQGKVKDVNIIWRFNRKFKKRCVFFYIKIKFLSINSFGSKSLFPSWIIGFCTRTWRGKSQLYSRQVPRSDCCGRSGGQKLNLIDCFAGVKKVWLASPLFHLTVISVQLSCKCYWRIMFIAQVNPLKNFQVFTLNYLTYSLTPNST